MDWHKRFIQQAAWTAQLRAYLFNQTGLAGSSYILEVGCGTGAILSTLPTNISFFGIDIQIARLREAHLHAPHASLIQCDAQTLPLPSSFFDVTFCHFTLLWLEDPLKGLLEMKRVTRPNGNLLVLAEPDYLSRRVKPTALADLVSLQIKSLRRRGADPGLGGRLQELFHLAGIPLVESGDLRQEKTHKPSINEWEMEWDVLAEDLSGMLSASEITRLKHQDKANFQNGDWELFIPTRYAWGRVPQMV